MKTIIFLMFMTLSSLMGFTAPLFEMTTYGQYLVLNTSEWNSSSHTVKIIDENGQIIYSKEFLVKDAHSLKRFNVAKLTPGTYQLEVNSLQYINRQSFIKTDALIKLNATIETITKPVIYIKGSTLKVNFLNLDHHADIQILDPNNVTLFEHTIDTPAYTQQFNLSQLPKGVYTVIITQEKERFVQTIEL